MLKLFHSIFGGDDGAERYPESLVREAIERAVDGTDPWLRGLSGYGRKLRPAVVHAIDHIVALVDGIDALLELSREAYGGDPRLRLFFISAEQMEEVLRRDPMLTALRRGAGQDVRTVWALLVMQCEQRGIFGVDLLGDTLVRDVPQVTVSMAEHRLLDPTADPAETRRHLKRRAFDHLLSLALARIAAVEDVREDLLDRRTLLQAKHTMLEGSGWGFNDTARATSPQLDEVHGELEKLEAQLFEFGGDDRYIEKHLEILIDVLAHAEQQLWVQPLTLIVDRMGIRRNTASDDAPKLTLQELHNAAGQKLVAQLVTIPAPAPAASPGSLH
ncbi:MAG: hypothetical protein FIB02_10070 [Desulfuromonas sp.]|nr:hypothetical protein [Desulfuromonas sp.]